MSGIFSILYFSSLSLSPLSPYIYYALLFMLCDKQAAHGCDMATMCCCLSVSPLLFSRPYYPCVGVDEFHQSTVMGAKK
jgi:hypothetical protein